MTWQRTYPASVIASFILPSAFGEITLILPDVPRIGESVLVHGPDIDDERYETIVFLVDDVVWTDQKQAWISLKFKQAEVRGEDLEMLDVDEPLPQRDHETKPGTVASA